MFSVFQGLDKEVWEAMLGEAC